jgi:ferredoxin
MAADYSIRNGYGRECSKQEILDYLMKADALGLVLQPGNSKETSFVCCCCGCCCAVLRTIKTLPHPADWVASPVAAVADRETCAGCGLCEDRCQMDALSQVDGAVALDTDWCIGCGLCVSTCPTESLVLMRKPEPQQAAVPANAVAAAISHGRARGKLGWGELIRMQVKFNVDRFLSPP